MKVSFPHMGYLYIPLKTLFKGLKLEVIAPPPISQKTMELGVKYSPEFACLPLKINMGNFIEALEQGADTIVMAGGWGPCRFGYYAQVEREILQELGYDFKMVVLEAPDSRISELLLQLKALGEKVSVREAYKAIRFAWKKLTAIERLEKKLEYCLPRAIDKNRMETLFERALQAIDEAESQQEVEKIAQESLKEMEKSPLTNAEVLKIGLVGEIYTILEPASNCHAARCLGRLDAHVSRSIYVSDWVNDHLFGGYLRKSNHKHIMQSSRPYLNYEVGGHGRETVGSMVDFARLDYNGIIQIAPLTCMPEIVAQSILGKVSEELEIPCMTMYFDEHSGAAGVYTRLEAFVDMLQRKKNLKSSPLWLEARA